MQHWPECYCRRVVAKPSLTMHVSIVHPSWFFFVFAHLVQWDVSDSLGSFAFLRISCSGT